MDIDADIMPSTPGLTNHRHIQKTNNRRAKLQGLNFKNESTQCNSKRKNKWPREWARRPNLVIDGLQKCLPTYNEAGHASWFLHTSHNAQYWTNKPMCKLTAVQNTEYTSTRTQIAQGKQTFAQGKQAFEQARKKQARKKQASEPRQEQASNQAGQANKQKQTQDKTQDKTGNRQTDNSWSHSTLSIYFMSLVL